MGVPKQIPHPVYEQRPIKEVPNLERIAPPLNLKSQVGLYDASLLNLNRPDVWTWETDQVLRWGTRAMAMFWSEGLSLEESKDGRPDRQRPWAGNTAGLERISSFTSDVRSREARQHCMLLFTRENRDQNVDEARSSPLRAAGLVDQ
ncbi:hypothetical protein M569_00175 [Genlisea aurea]|uniref:Uncharacterized protein n=1 Tax=Genlisea aurea TaxID=192259 RepID=S8DAN8_9LAMI|nr:hypothetical protein M569_00175 [Genlisea aurea]